MYAVADPRGVRGGGVQYVTKKRSVIIITVRCELVVANRLVLCFRPASVHRL